ncbi:MAG: hypothetical protein AUJ52_06035 [Elusimicrobia bacterium CG1_02_63_36]|nr:MAG: hypothetical protein AUJ52_06035 [Elusimicrobia bacterium CG1_02_63_36]PIP81413.1 MAG: hypothetical protein COR54_20340 [Elusimicrobia bacterium CG22_combo_CG10-13_8_21_14_all_63_91]PJA14936.1 MAG: hypothetical protein COX66_11375 [Elusimicrobia bacterium CG_4_10_14_0_2_um_filter_63_34]PJB24533.1 MAG: hypothetical protein CO113_13310 [Elusimicrobia bacterium CG_4_9_14_3_um_filter_62_55]
MSESHYIEECGRGFRVKHKAEDGWIVFRIDLNSRGVYTPHLPAFLLAEAPQAVVRSDLYYDVGWSDGGRRTLLSEIPWKRRGLGFAETGWFGELDLEWRGTHIHYGRYTRQRYQGFSSTDTTWIATKDRAAFEDLQRALVRFYRRHFKARKDINIVNGDWIKKPKLSWSDLILPERMAEEIRTGAESFISARAQYRGLGLPYRRGFLFAGPPGVGKTFAAKVIFSQLRASAYAFDLKAEIDDDELRRAFRCASEDTPSVLLLEDLDRIVDSKKVSMSYFLNLLDGLQPREGVLVIATTNAPENLDQALLHRPSRFDRVWHFPLPGRIERLRLLEKKGRKHFSGDALHRAADRSSGFTMAYTQEAVVSALLSAVHEKRPPQDSDLAVSVEILARQVRESRKKDGAIKAECQVGFAAANGMRSQ